MKLEDLLNQDLDSAIGWLEENSHKYYLVPKDFMSDFDKECNVESVDAIEQGAPRGEILDSMDMNEEMLYTLNKIITEG